MTSKDYLKQAQQLNDFIKADFEELEKLKGDCFNLSARSISSSGGNGSQNHDPAFIKCLEKIEQLKADINFEIDTYFALKIQIRKSINQLENHNERMILKMKYINGNTLEQVADKLNKDIRTVKRWHNSALQHFCVYGSPIII